MPYSRDDDGIRGTKIDSKQALLGVLKLDLVEDFVEFAEVLSPSFNTSLIMYWSHHLPIPFTDSLPIFQSLVNHQESLVMDPIMVKLCYQELSYDQVKSRRSIEV